MPSRASEQAPDSSGAHGWDAPYLGLMGEAPDLRRLEVARVGKYGVAARTSNAHKLELDANDLAHIVAN